MVEALDAIAVLLPSVEVEAIPLVQPEAISNLPLVEPGSAEDPDGADASRGVGLAPGGGRALFSLAAEVQLVPELVRSTPVV